VNSYSPHYISKKEEKIMNFDHIALIVFVVLVTIFLIYKRKKIDIEKLLFPIFYLVIYRTNIGLRWMDRVSEKYRELIKLFGYFCIGFGFFGLVFISVSIIWSMFKFFLAPKTTELGMVLVLPGTNIPGIGYLSFFHFIIAILILAIVHEFAHGVVARAHDLKVKSSGFAFLAILLPILPAAFVEPDEKKMAKREPHVQYSILSAGPISNVLLSLVFLVLLLFVMAPIEARITEPIGFSFDVTEGYPADFAGIKSRTVIDSFNGEKVTNYDKFIEELQSCTGPNEVVVLGSGDEKYKVKTIAHPDDASRGFIGVTSIKNEAKLKDGKVFFWFKGLFRWLFMLNILIGLINLLPIYITDGARMLLIALQSSIKNKKKAIKVWSVINWAFVLLILIGLFATYLKKFGLF